jgi:hypothetical protein
MAHPIDALIESAHACDATAMAEREQSLDIGMIAALTGRSLEF